MNTDTEERRWTPAEISKSLIFKTLTYRAAGFISKPLLLLKVAQDALDKADKESSLKGIALSAFANLQRLVRLVKAYANGTYREVSNTNLIKVVGTILYFITPIDVIPDAIPMLGLLDDITLMGWVISTLGEELDKFEAFENKQDAAAKITKELTYNELYEMAKVKEIPGRSGMSKEELLDAVKASS